MLFAAACADKPNSVETRMANRPAHLAYLASLGARVRVGGALLDAEAKSPLGSLIIFEAASEAEVRAMLAEDPYTKAGLFASIDLKPWRQAIGAQLAE
ncbi:MAG: YciI family protein [Bradyrhizobium sp.]|nr:MAG: YciI family protein [Bradyrhizobium sp.]